jgi:hypothetical protein
MNSPITYFQLANHASTSFWLWSFAYPYRCCRRPSNCSPHFSLILPFASFQFPSTRFQSMEYPLLDVSVRKNAETVAFGYPRERLFEQRANRSLWLSATCAVFDGGRRSHTINFAELEFVPIGTELHQPPADGLKAKGNES